MRMALTLLIAIALIAACTTTPSSDPEPLQPQGVTYGGCAGQFEMPAAVLDRWDSGDPYGESDTLIVAWDDSLEIFLGLNYICCAPFVAEHEVVQDTLVLAVRDTCPDPNAFCYCRCMCTYTFTWKFAGGGEDLRHLRVELYDPRLDAVEVLYREELE
jgi:hypothetical protein